MNNFINEYKKNGYFSIPNIFNIDEIKFLRNNLEKEYELVNFKKRDLLINELRNKELIKLILKGFNSKHLRNISVEFAKEYNNNVAILPFFHVMRNYHVDISSHHGWHRDCGGELAYKYCKDILSKKDYLFSKCGFYLQENSNNYGGAIDIVEKSNKFFGKSEIFQRKINAIPFKFMELTHKISKKIYNFLYEGKFSFLKGHKTLFPQLGSAVFFDSKIIHRGTVAKDLKKENFTNDYQANISNKEKTKFAIYAHFGTSEAIDSYMYDRLKRHNNKNEIKLWLEQIEFIKEYEFDLYKDATDILKKIKKKYC